MWNVTFDVDIQYNPSGVSVNQGPVGYKVSVGRVSGTNVHADFTETFPYGQTYSFPNNTEEDTVWVHPGINGQPTGWDSCQGGCSYSLNTGDFGIDFLPPSPVPTYAVVHYRVRPILAYDDENLPDPDNATYGQDINYWKTVLPFSTATIDYPNSDPLTSEL